MKQDTALLVMDVQIPLIGNLINEIAAGFIHNVAKAIAKARIKAMPVIYVRAGFRKNAPEINANNKFFFANKEMFSNTDPERWMQIHSDLLPHEHNIIVTKRRISAFTGSDLEVVLRAQRICHLVLTGISTGGVVLSTVREAADKDYQLTVLSDGYADVDEEVHRVLITKVLPRKAEVITVTEWTRD